MLYNKYKPYLLNTLFPPVALFRAFQFPSDMHLEPEYWAEMGSLDEVERQELEVMQNELFSVRPKRGELQPGEKITATCIYR